MIIRIEFLGKLQGTEEGKQILSVLAKKHVMVTENNCVPKQNYKIS